MNRTTSFVRATVMAIGLIGLTACSNLDDTQQKVLSGGAAGAIIGTVGVAITGGCIPCGTAIGGAVGAGTGYVLDQLDKDTKSGPGGGQSSSYNSSSNYSAPMNNGNNGGGPGYTTSNYNSPASGVSGGSGTGPNSY